MSIVGFARRATLLALAALMGTLLVPALPAAATNADVTGPYGPLGFTTMGLGKTSSYGEPSLAISDKNPNIAIVSTPGGGGVVYWYSQDGGKSWHTTTTKYGGGDSALDFLPDGTALSGDLHIQNSGVSISHSGGETWSTAAPAGTEQDRQWFAHSPDGRHQYMVYHDFVAEAEFISQSSDGGQTWTTAPQDQIRVNQPQQAIASPIFLGAKPGDQVSAADQGVNTFSGPMLIDKNGKDWYVIYSISDGLSNFDPTGGIPPYGPVRALVVAHSNDGGATWNNIYADTPDGTFPTESMEGTMFPWGMIDDAGTVYVVFNSTRGGAPTDHFHQYYVYSKDKGATWSKPVRIDGLAIGQGATAMATGAAVSPGVVDIAWYQSDNGTPSNDSSTWVPHFAQVRGADTDHPSWVEQAVTTVPNHTTGICLQGTLCATGQTPGSHDRSLLDFFQVKVNPRTGLAMIAYADNARLGKDASGKRIGEVVVAQQTLGAATATAGPDAVVVPQFTGGGSQLPMTAAEPVALRAALILVVAALLVAAGLAAGSRARGKSAGE